MTLTKRLQKAAGIRASIILSMCLLLNGCGPTARLLEPEPDWIFLAQGKVNHVREKDVFRIDSRDKFSAIKLYVYHRGVSIRSVEITLINGDVLRPALERYIEAGNRSRAIELPAEGRQVEKIAIRYRADGKLFSDKALVQIAGLRPLENRR